MKFIKGYKTYLISALLVGVSIVELLTGGISLVEFLGDPDLLILLNGLGLAALRNGVE